VGGFGPDGSGPPGSSALSRRGVAQVTGEGCLPGPAYAHGVAPAPGGGSRKVRFPVASFRPFGPGGLCFGLWHAVVLAPKRALRFPFRGVDGAREDFPGCVAFVDDRVPTWWPSALLPVSRSALLGSRDGGRGFVAHGVASLGSSGSLSPNPFPVDGSRSRVPR